MYNQPPGAPQGARGSNVPLAQSEAAYEAQALGQYEQQMMAQAMAASQAQS